MTQEQLQGTPSTQQDASHHVDSLRLGPTERLQCLEGVQAILQEIVNTKGSDSSSEDRLPELNLAYAAEKLLGVLNVDSAAIFLKEYDKLFLVASVDAAGLVSTQRRLGVKISLNTNDLTSFILKEERSLRIDNILDHEEVRRYITNVQEEISLFEEFAADHGAIPYLGVPMRAHGKAVGVIRLLRKSQDSTFSDYEENVLQFFADILGSIVYHSWHLRVSNAVITAEAEADLISRREIHANGESIPIVVYADHGAERLFGLNRLEIEGRDAREFYDVGEYDKVADALRESIRQGKRECGPIKARLRCPRRGFRNGGISFRTIHSPYSNEKYTISVIRDITVDQEKADQHSRLLELLSEKGIAYFRADSKGTTIETSPAEMRILGYTEDELLGTMDRRELFHDSKKRIYFFKKMLSRKGDKREQLVRTRQYLRRKTGDCFWSDAVIRIMYDRERGNLGVEGIYEDASEKIRLENFLDIDLKKLVGMRELYSKLAMSEEFHLNFLTSLGHQLKTPLGAVVGHLLNIKDDLIDNRKAIERLEYAIGQVNLCALLGTNLNCMDRVLRSGNFEMDTISFKSLVSSVALDFAHLLRAKKLSLKIEGDRIDRDLRIWGNRDLLRQVVINLMDNAIKYSARNGCIEIQGYRNDTGRVFEISNNGIPVQGEHREAIFDRGFRTPKARMAVPHGTGLGLWLVRKIVHAHMQSRIECIAEERPGGERTIFRITFPEELAVKECQ